MELNIEKFSPTVAELREVAATAAQIELQDPLDKAAVQVVHDMRVALRTARTTITKAGKEMREDALKFQRAVIAKEHELIAIIEPQEERLERLEEDALLVQEREALREFLPRRKERLAALQDGVAITDEELLDMDGTVFEGYFNRRLAEKNVADQRKIDDDRRKLNADQEEIDRKKREQEAEERGRKQAEEKAEREKKEREARAAAEAAEREKDALYQAFLKEHGYNREDFYTTQEIGGAITLWKKVATFNPNQ